MSLPQIKGNDRQVLAALVVLCFLVAIGVVYAEYRDVNDAYSLAGRVLDRSKDVSSYQFDIHSNISMMGESFGLVKGNGSVDYKEARMAVRLQSIDSSMDVVVIDDNAYFRNNGGSWETKNLNRQTWDNYDQLTRSNLLLANSTGLSMEIKDSYFILIASPDSNALLYEAEKAGIELTGDEKLNEYSIRYMIGKDDYRIRSIEIRVEFMMNVQGLMSPVTMNNRVDIYDYDADVVIEAPSLTD